MSFAALLELAIAEIRRQVQNGLWTERRLAHIAGLSQPHVHHALNGVRTPSPGAMDRLLRAAGVNLAQLVDGEKCQMCRFRQFASPLRAVRKIRPRGARARTAQPRPRDSATSR